VSAPLRLIACSTEMQRAMARIEPSLSIDFSSPPDGETIRRATKAVNSRLGLREDNNR